MKGINDIPETHGMFNHPSDYGMEQIAKRFFEAIEPVAKAIVMK